MLPLLLLTVSARAQEEESEEALGPTSAPVVIPPEERPFQMGVEYRLWGTNLSPFPLDPTGIPLGASTFAEHRLRVTPAFALTRRLRLVGSADLLTGLILGDTTDRILAADEPRAELNGFETARLRQFFAEYRFLGTPSRPGGAVRMGLQTSHFGLGLLTNDGQSASTDWGLVRFGDESIRFLLGGYPLAIASRGKRGVPWRLVLAADLVRADALANLARGDRALQGVASLLYTTENISGGLYAAARAQSAPLDVGDLDAETLHARAADLFFSLRKELGESLFSFALEGALIQGATTLTRSEALPDGARILQGGGVLRTSLRNSAFEGEIELGYASGDPNPEDDILSRFSFNRDFNVSLLLFEEVFGSLTARDGSRATDPNLSQVPRDGAEFIPTNGAVSGAAYGKLTGRYFPRESTRFVVALLAAQATADIVAPFASFENGGVFTNYLGGDPRNRFLGVEGDVGVFHRLYIGQAPLVFSLQGGLLLPGDAFTNAAGEKMAPVYTIQAGLSLPALLDP